nr:hypothetical protein [Methylomarinum sp. Ch1-1]MDP4520252.1 hypothetical protein [Methylomarinum sp. Ch1-1]
MKKEAKSAQAAKPAKETKPAQVAQPAPAAKQDVIDLAKDAEQCQSATAKGSRCSRTRNLEVIDAVIEGRQYRFRTCKQHHTEDFKPFPELLK